ncbi:putative sporulation integral membrane protein YlbJ [Anopheles sinensis]|uniref:Putative sporulation integral membrane protein YlbJ n=1 Tax=Anopheles sinensis TaxID=74873 RepID=A0A084W8W4_ANOSI|nr:putative sporulation integral membrane protein YlbJ [Anopheles sinensis]
MQTNLSRHNRCYALLSACSNDDVEDEALFISGVDKRVAQSRQHGDDAPKEIGFRYIVSQSNSEGDSEIAVAGSPAMSKFGPNVLHKTCDLPFPAIECSSGLWVEVNGFQITHWYLPRRSSLPVVRRTLSPASQRLQEAGSRRRTLGGEQSERWISLIGDHSSITDDGRWTIRTMFPHCADCPAFMVWA